jgi:hypothetical protein
MARNSELISIYVAWKNGDATPYIVYNVKELGEGAARQRAAQRVALCQASGYPVTSFRFDYADGDSSEMMG